MTRENAARIVEALENFVAERACLCQSSITKQKTANALLDALVAIEPGMTEWEESADDGTVA